MGLIQNAECVLTNSFHGTIFSVVMGKRLYVDIGKDKMNEVNNRMTEFLDRTGLNYPQDINQI